MVGRIIRKVSSAFYSYPDVPEDVENAGRFGRLKIALVADHFTSECLAAECRVRSVTPRDYRQVIGEWKPDMVFVESAFHAFDGFRFERNEPSFTGSYYRRILNARRQFLDMVFDALGEAGMRLHAYDRNYGRFSRHFAFRYPDMPYLTVHPTVSHRDTGRVYKAHVASLNVNSVTGSETMCSRRLIEILACGGIAVTNPSRSVQKYFADFCHVVSDREETAEVFGRLRQGPSAADLDRAEAGARYVREMHTWTHRLEEVCAVVGI